MRVWRREMGQLITAPPQHLLNKTVFPAGPNSGLGSELCTVPRYRPFPSNKVYPPGVRTSLLPEETRASARRHRTDTGRLPVLVMLAKAGAFTIMVSILSPLGRRFSGPHLVRCLGARDGCTARLRSHVSALHSADVGWLFSSGVEVQLVLAQRFRQVSSD